jgi:hypothetical protein
MLRRGFEECENKFPSTEVSKTLNSMISRKIFAALNVKMGNIILDMCNLDFKN